MNAEHYESEGSKAMQLSVPRVAVRGTVVCLATAMVLWLGLFAAPTSGASPNRYALGDSVMLGAASQLRAHGFAVNARESRQVASGVATLRHVKSRGRLASTVVVGLGTNGSFSFAQCRSMHRVVGPNRKLFLVTVKVARPWARPDNAVIRRCSAHFTNVFLIDWQQQARRHGSYFYRDGYHLTPMGARAYARLVARTVRITG